MVGMTAIVLHICNVTPIELQIYNIFYQCFIVLQ